MISKNTPKRRFIMWLKGKHKKCTIGQKSMQHDLFWNEVLAQNILCSLHGMGNSMCYSYQSTMLHYHTACLIRQIVSNYVRNKTVDFTSGSCIILELQCQAYYTMIYWFGKLAIPCIQNRRMPCTEYCTHGINTSLVASHTVWKLVSTTE